MRWSSLRLWTKHRSRSYRSRWFSIEQKPRGRTVDVPVGGSGTVQLDIQLPQRAPQSDKNNILIYLPSGVAVLKDAKDGTSNSTQIPTILSSLLPAYTIIALNYRLNPPTHIFPLPIHDTATAFNYVLRTFTKHTVPKISLLGSHLGGTLATSLALTSPNSIHSVAVSEPVLDWVSLDSDDEDNSSLEIPIPIKRRPKPYQYTSKDAKSLLSLRSKIFRTPDNYFDPFASPTLFLRAPGRDCPQPYLPSDATIGSDAFGPYDDDTHTGTHPVSSSSTTEQENAAGMRPIKRRKVLRRWPANGPPESADLPHFRVFVSDDPEGEGMVLRQQGEELVELMRKVCFYGQEKEVADMNVGVDVLPGVRSETDMLGVEQAVGWLARQHEEEG